jgi:nucleotide-binding universal stress UspA family protein
VVAAVTFQRVVCGVDGSAAGLEAARQGLRLRAPDGWLLLLAAEELELAVHGGWAAGTIADELRHDAREALDAARRDLGDVAGVEARLAEGAPWPSLADAIRKEQATLVCVGSHEHTRAGGVLLGSVATTALHEAPCAVLVARPSRSAARFPASIAAGCDGSPGAETAVAVAAELAARHGASLRIVVATGGREVDAEAVRAAHPVAEVDGRRPRDALLAASEDADLLVLGSRGLHGVRALGSVSERVAHEASCSVLVVR